MKKIISFAILIIFFPSILLAAPSTGNGISLGFEDALRIADKNSADILTSRDQMEQALARINQARSYFFPELSAEISESRQTVNLETFGIPPTSASAPSVVGPFNVFDARLRITQTLFDLSMVKRFQAALAGHELSKAESRKIQEDVLALAGTLYAQARRAQSRVEFAKENLRLAILKDRIIRQRHRLGTASDSEVGETKASLSDARYFWRSSLNNYSAALLDLKTTLGFSPRQSLVLQEDDLAKIGLSKSNLVDQIAAVHPEVNVRRAMQKEEEEQEAAEQASYWPSIQGTADYGVNGKTIDGAKDTYYYGANAVWNFFDFGRKSSRVREAQSRVQEAKTNFSQTLREKESKIYEAKNELKKASKFFTYKNDQWLYEKKLYGIAKKKFQNGSTSRLELIAASASTARASDEREEAESLYRIAGIGFYHAMGQMQKFLEKQS